MLDIFLRLYTFTWTEHSHWIWIIRLVKDSWASWKLQVQSWLRIDNRFLFWLFLYTFISLTRIRYWIQYRKKFCLYRHRNC